jgi:hypothetical protein
MNNPHQLFILARYVNLRTFAKSSIKSFSNNPDGRIGALGIPARGF